MPKYFELLYKPFVDQIFFPSLKVKIPSFRYCQTNSRLYFCCVLLELVIHNGLTISIAATNNSGYNKAIASRGTDDSILLFFHFSESEYGFDQKPTAYELKCHFPFQYLNNYFSPHQENYLDQFDVYAEHDLCCTKQLILHEIIHCKIKGAYQQMFLESKALGLLVSFQKCKTLQPSNCDSCKFLIKPTEKTKIHKAKEIILSRLKDPLTIPELSLEVGINQCYLKKGFKEIFGTTVYDFLQEQRMLKAKLLLTSTNLTVSEIAEEIGFSSLSNFSTAFKKQTGVFPSELQKSVT